MISLQNLNNQLTALKMAFDKSISNGNSFSKSKKFYMQMKDVKQKIKSLQIGMLKSEKKDE